MRVEQDGVRVQEIENAVHQLVLRGPRGVVNTGVAQPREMHAAELKWSQKSDKICSKLMKNCYVSK